MIKLVLHSAHSNPQPKRQIDRFSRFGRPFVKRFALLSDFGCLPVCPVLSVSPVCDVGVLWPDSWMDQDTTWHGGRPRHRPHCVRWGAGQKGHSPPPF